MTAKRRFTFDTNILVYAVDLDETIKREDAHSIITSAARCDCILTVQALAEFFRATTRKGLLDYTRASGLVRDWLDTFETVSANDSTLTEAINTTTNKKISFWDSMILATARQNGCSVLLSENMQDGQQFDGIEILNPFSEHASERLELLLNA